MKIEILGSGGSVVTPRPGCRCSTCNLARMNGAPYRRTGPAVFIHDYSLLIDTSEDIAYQLNRSEIYSVDHCIYSHWHGDHVLGYRIWYTLNYDFGQNPNHKKTYIHLFSSQEDPKVNLGHLDHLMEFQTKKLIQVFKHEANFKIRDLSVESFQLGEPEILGFLLTVQEKRIIIVMDDTYGWVPDKRMEGSDLVILPIGLFDVHPISGKQLMHPDHYLLRGEATFRDTVSLIDRLSPKMTYLSHIEEHDHIGFDSFAKIDLLFEERGKKIFCARDTTMIEI